MVVIYRVKIFGIILVYMNENLKQTEWKEEMRFLEIIDIRSTESMGKELRAELKDLAKEVNEKEDREKMKIYIHTKINNDFSIHIIHNTNTNFEKGSQLGMAIISSFKKYGLINHNIWIRKE